MLDKENLKLVSSAFVLDALLRAQDYYNGRRHIWIPKASLQIQIQQEKPKLVQARIPLVSQVWRLFL